MKFYIPKTPSCMMRFFSKYTWCFSRDVKEIYLTFDDGPTPEVTQFVLDELKKYNAKATFFCIGKNILNHPDVFKKIKNSKHTIGNHTYNHLNGWATKNKDYFDNFLQCEPIISKTLDESTKPKLFRPPYGKIKKSQAKSILKKGYRIIMWDVLSADFDVATSKEECLRNVLNNTKNGSIIVFHDSVKASEKLKFVLPKVLKEFSEKGFVFKAI
ncbi:MAG: peptidoglycan/xylan/chitin deacetylase (PgdA/CDA1 family) [Polaribacter sp.]|jgi:peptidoglycan/xylan/chitin deacetylase (PgdA/CDA1 family)